MLINALIRIAQGLGSGTLEGRTNEGRAIESSLSKLSNKRGEDLRRKQELCLKPNLVREGEIENKERRGPLAQSARGGRASITREAD